MVAVNMILTAVSNEPSGVKEPDPLVSNFRNLFSSRRISSASKQAPPTDELLFPILRYRILYAVEYAVRFSTDRELSCISNFLTSKEENRTLVEIL